MLTVLARCQLRSAAVPPCLHVVIPDSVRLTMVSPRAISNYNGLVASYSTRVPRLGNGLAQVNYTFGHEFWMSFEQTEERDPH